MSDLIAATDEHARALNVLLADWGKTVATAESLTGGLVGAAITELPGASAVYRGGIVAYSTLAKEQVLGVPVPLLREFGPVHATTALAMARHARMLFGADLGVATTGVAGPDPVGDIAIAVEKIVLRNQVQPVLEPGRQIGVRNQGVVALANQIELTQQRKPII